MTDKIKPKYKTPFKLPNGVEIADVHGHQRDWWNGLNRRRQGKYPESWKLTDQPGLNYGRRERTELPTNDSAAEYIARRIAQWALWRARAFGLLTDADGTPDIACLTHEGGRDGFAWLVTFKFFGAGEDRKIMVLVPDWPVAGEPVEEQMEIAA